MHLKEARRGAPAPVPVPARLVWRATLLLGTASAARIYGQSFARARTRLRDAHALSGPRFSGQSVISVDIAANEEADFNVIVVPSGSWQEEARTVCAAPGYNAVPPRRRRQSTPTCNAAPAAATAAGTRLMPRLPCLACCALPAPC